MTTVRIWGQWGERGHRRRGSVRRRTTSSDNTKYLSKLQIHRKIRTPHNKVYFESRSFSASCLRRRETSIYIYKVKLNRYQECWVWNHHLIMIHPRTDTVCKRDASGWVWGFLFYCYGGVRQCGYGVHGGNTTNCDPWEPEA